MPALAQGCGGIKAAVYWDAVRKEAVLFVNKKNQKNFFNLGRCLVLAKPQRNRPSTKVFCFFFLKKNRFLP